MMINEKLREFAERTKDEEARGLAKQAASKIDSLLEYIEQLKNRLAGWQK